MELQRCNRQDNCTILMLKVIMILLENRIVELKLVNEKDF